MAMKNVIILGCGRSGTSMLAGIVSNNRYFIGSDYIEPRESNPKGFFEGREINEINERLIARLSSGRHRPRLRLLGKSSVPGPGQRWLSRIPAGVEIPRDPEIECEIEKLTQFEPYCFKDPRFCYTLPIWRDYLKNEVYICVYRDPADTVASILKECRTEEYLNNLKIDAEAVFDLWHLMYSRITDAHSRRGRWTFVHYDQLFRTETIEQLGHIVESKVCFDFADKGLNRTKSQQKSPEKVLELYHNLNRLAGHDLSQ